MKEKLKIASNKEYVFKYFHPSSLWKPPPVTNKSIETKVKTRPNAREKDGRNKTLLAIQAEYKIKLAGRKLDSLSDKDFYDIEAKPNTNQHYKIMAVDPGDNRPIHEVTNKVVI